MSGNVPYICDPLSALSVHLSVNMIVNLSLLTLDMLT